MRRQPSSLALVFSHLRKADVSCIDLFTPLDRRATRAAVPCRTARANATTPTTAGRRSASAKCPRSTSRNPSSTTPKGPSPQNSGSFTRKTKYPSPVFLSSLSCRRFVLCAANQYDLGLNISNRFKSCFKTMLYFYLGCKGGKVASSGRSSAAIRGSSHEVNS